MTTLLNTFLNHRSYRVYQDKPVENEKLDLILRAVQAAPNWVNTQHLSIIVIKDPVRRQKMAELCGNQPYIAQTPVFLVFCADFYRTALACAKYGQNIDEIMGDIDHVVVGTHEAGIALGTAVAAAEQLGLGTVPIGDVRLNPLALIDELKLPKYVFPVLGLCIGYPDLNQDPGIKPRLPKNAVCFNETYQTDSLEEKLEAFDQQYHDYLQLRPWNSRVGNWTQLVADFYKAPYQHYPEEMEMLKQQGFLAD